MFSKLRKQAEPERVEGLAGRHFTMLEERPLDISAVGIEALDPFLRNLLFTDGTVTRALAAQTLAPVAVERISQSPLALAADVAECLEVTVGEEAIGRWVGIGIGSPAIPVLWAESFMLPDRLPPGFLSLLESAPDGIGQSLQRVSLESSRELLWFGLDSLPEWAEEAPGESSGTLRRLYRIVSGGKPAILISEYFAVELRLDTYHLAGLLAHEARVATEGVR